MEETGCCVWLPIPYCFVLASIEVPVISTPAIVTRDEVSVLITVPLRFPRATGVPPVTPSDDLPLT